MTLTETDIVIWVFDAVLSVSLFVLCRSLTRYRRISRWPPLIPFRIMFRIMFRMISLVWHPLNAFKKLNVNSAYGKLGKGFAGYRQPFLTTALHPANGYLYSMNYIMSGMGALTTGSETNMPLPETEQAEPFTGWKAIHVNYVRPYWEMSSRFDSSMVKATGGVARCPNYVYPDEGLAEDQPPPSVPEDNCSCGWYAYKDHKRLSDDTDVWLAKVRLYGKVIEYSEGFRAEKQDIVEVWAPDGYYDDHLHLLKEQIPDVVWHVNDRPQKSPVVQAYDPMPGLIPADVQLHYAPYDVLPKECVDALMPNQHMQYPLPFYKNASMGMIARFTVVNQGIQLELQDYNGHRIMGPVTFTASKYHWYGSDGKQLG